MPNTITPIGNPDDTNAANPNTNPVTLFSNQDIYDLWHGRAATLRLLTDLRSMLSYATCAVECGETDEAIATLYAAQTQISLTLCS